MPASGHWQPAAVEFPISFGLPGTFESRIDVVLTDTRDPSGPWHLVVECKRSHPDYKQWIFFDQKGRVTKSEGDGLFIQRADFTGSWNHQGKVPLTKRIDRVPAPKDCPVFNFYLETRLNPGRRDQRASATEAIEQAFRQVGVGVVGLGRVLHDMNLYHFRFLPLVVTTADIASAKFDAQSVSLSHGKIEPKDLTLERRPWVAVNYRIDESVSRFAEMTGGLGRDVSEALMYRYLRTMFVVRAAHLREFLIWFETHLQKTA